MNLCWVETAFMLLENVQTIENDLETYALRCPYLLKKFLLFGG